jgi:hypothetical protein
MSARLGPLTVILAVASLSCGSDPPRLLLPSPTPTPTPTPTPAPVVLLTSLRIVGSNVLRAVGETSQLTATGTFSDGTTRDVTPEAAWTSLNPSRFRVSAGTVTALAFGVGSISVTFQGRSSGIQMFATPPNTYVFHGRAREAGSGGVSGVRVVETMSNRSELTDQNGNYQIADLTTARFRFEKEGYELAEIAPATPAATAPPGVYAEAALQRVVRLAAGSSMNGLELAPHDLEYTIGSERCYPCKLVRVTTVTAGRLRVDATWPGQANSLNVWLTGTRFRPSGSTVSAEATVDAGEILVYVGFNLPQNQSLGSYITFSVSTTLDAS